MDNTVIPLLQLPTQKLLDEFGAGRHKPGSGSAAALLGLVACKLIQTVIAVTRRNPAYAPSMAQLDYVEKISLERDEPFFREAVQRDSEEFDRYQKLLKTKRTVAEENERARYTELARQQLMPCTEIPLEIARHAADTADRGLLLFGLGAKYARGDSGVAISAALSSCSGALFIVYLNLMKFREGRWATAKRTEADEITRRYHDLQLEQFRRVSKMQSEGLVDPQIEFSLPLEIPDTEEEV